MTFDPRQNAAAYYDRFSSPPAGDADFYRSRIGETTRVLELGCGTGRVLVPLADVAGYVHGLDSSPAMLEICRRKLNNAGMDESRARAEEGDITDFDLTHRMPEFDLIIAPFRVMQNLETDEQVDGLMRCIGKHLKPEGVAILNTFRPSGGPDAVKGYWESLDGRSPRWSMPDGEETVTMTEVCTRYREDPLTVFPDLIYRRYNSAGKPADEAVLSIAMRVWYPDELVGLIESCGFVVTAKFGGYEGERWDEGSELVVAFKHTDR